MAAKGAGESAVRARGASGVSSFRFSRDGGGAVFHAKNYPEAKRIFIDFIEIVQSYRKTKGLEPLNDDHLYTAEERKPAPMPGNYTAMTDGRFDAFRDAVHKKFSGMSASMDFGKYSVTVYAKSDDAVFPPGMRPPPERQLLLDFKRLYSLDDAACVSVKTRGEYYVYFLVNRIGLFYNNEDSSREFLEREHRELARLLTIMPNLDTIKRLDEAKSGVTKYDLGYKRVSEGNYRLFINGKETGMRIYAMYPLTQSSPGGVYDKPSERPMLWIGEGGGRKEGRYYRSLDSALLGEREFVNRVFTSGGIETLMKSEQ
jgi:hypothetical protein